ncbi:hypothetical protein WA026_008435 [Henosepilachna vigintioctopunctata]|uniref:HTH psq-type domain-containing protein n=1 Tax=Henosepilachna vigintioctopunctata TaxID=420089 RepID=A0AAW1UFJ6_9CUCU
MGRPAKPRTIGKHTADDMKAALENIKNGMSVRKASKLSVIPFTTLRRYFHKIKNMNIDQATSTPNYSINKVFNEEQEKNLKDYFTYCALLFYGLSTKECRRIAYQMAHKEKSRNQSCEPREEASAIQPPLFQDYNDMNISGPSIKDSFQLEATTKLANSRFSSSSEVIFEEDVRSASNLAENVSVTLQSLDNITSLEKNDSPSILQESNDREPTPSAYGNSEISGNLISSPPPPPIELVANINLVTFAETTPSIVVKKSKIISPFEFRNPIKAGPRKSKRKTRKLGRSLIATDTPEKLEIEMDKNLTKKRKEAKKRKTAKKILHSDSENEELLEIPYQKSDEDNDWFDEEVENRPVPITSNYLERPLSHTPQEGEYVLVEFSTKKTQIYYVGIVLESRNEKWEYCISFLRQKSINKFHNPNEPDISYVKEHDIKLILPKPDISGSTSRQQSYLSFATDLSLLNIR